MTCLRTGCWRGGYAPTQHSAGSLRAPRGLLIANTGGPVLATARPILVAEKSDGQRGWRVYHPDLYPDLTAAL